jgi:Pentapeptide repeats (8 copies)
MERIGVVRLERRLGSDRLDVRLGAIDALERIMIDSALDHPTIVEVLAAFVREHAPAAASGPDPDGGGQPEQHPSTAPDVQAAVTVLGRRPAGRAEHGPVNLASANLFGATVFRANLAGADLDGANLFGADLTCADLRGANLTLADLGCANLAGATLAGANLTLANLTLADLTGADLAGATLTEASLGGTDLTGVALTDEQRRATN